MRHYSARQRTDGRWDFTCGNQPVGYCGEFIEWGDNERKMFGENFANHVIEEQKDYKFRHKHHIDGHATAEEACECYKQYLLDNNMRVSNNKNSQHKCGVCGEWTTQFVQVGESWLRTLCEKHSNKEEVEKIYKAPSEIWCS